jgi:hypothetical protein
MTQAEGVKPEVGNRLALEYKYLRDIPDLLSQRALCALS